MALLREWQRAHNPGPDQAREIRRWRMTELSADFAQKIEWDIEDWLADRSLPEPDMIKCIAAYSRAVLISGNWKTEPFMLTEKERQAWREEGVFSPTLFELRENIGGAAGGLLELAGRDPALFVEVINRQLKNYLNELDELVSWPLTHWTPQDFDEDEINDGDESYMFNMFNRPLEQYEYIFCFERAMERLRMLCLTEQNPELGLPNQELFMALSKQINLNYVLFCLQQAKPKLENILKHWTKHQWFSGDELWTNNADEPEIFWWRHWGTDRSKKYTQ